MNLLYLDNIYKAYDEKDVLNGLNLDINKGEIVFCWTKWCWKTTLVKIILGLSRPDEGTVLLNSKELRVPFSNTDKLCLGYVPDEPIFIEYLTGLENLKYYCKLYNKNSSNEHLLSIMKAYDIYSSADKFRKTIPEV
ncbi:ATP-binding cassette domain-containing protein [Bacillus megaterium]|nr:ATP-binding cassette domain-containing protein [Priestia megaterium]